MSKLNIAIVIDMQNDFISGTLGSDDRIELPSKIKDFLVKNIEDKDFKCFFTQDTHLKNEKSYESSLLPSHCIKESKGWKITDELACYSNAKNTIEKSSFMAGEQLIESIKAACDDHEDIEIWLCGVCTDICVIANAFLLRREFPNAKINVLSQLCMGTNRENHESAIKVLKSSLFNIV